ncbi:MAG: PcfJ domain-containing protein [Bryobacteraceae bacterium]
MKQASTDSFQLPPISPEHVTALKELPRICASCELWPNGIYQLYFRYLTWPVYRQYCFRELARRTGLSRLPETVRKERAIQFCKIAAGFAGSKKTYEARTRKLCYAKMIAALRGMLPGLNDETVQLLAGSALSHCMRGEGSVRGSVQFKVSWDMETLREFLAYCRHDLPADKVNTVADINRHVLRHLDTLPLTCRRKVKNYVLQHRHYCRDYDLPARLKALDCSFKYTGSAYAFRKARDIALALYTPESFFKRAGQKIRMRQYSAWLREQWNHFEDMYGSLRDIPEPDSRFNSWADLERHSRNWHARQIAEARVGLKAVSYEPFNLPPEVPRTFNIKGYAFSLLASPEEMADESVQMHHCIHSYAEGVRSGDYLAYGVNGGGERATFGLRKAGRRWVFDQVRGKRNAFASEELRAACMEFTVPLNTQIRSSRKKKEAA